MRTRSLAIPILWAAAACTAEVGPAPEGSSGLQLTQMDDTTIAGSFERAGSYIEFRSVSLDQQRATLHLDVNGAQLDAVLDLTAKTAVQDGYLHALYGDDVAALLALRDALGEADPAMVETLQGKLLVRHADHLAEAPVGATIDHREYTLVPANTAVTDRADADGCGGDGATCLWGDRGYDYAVFDQGNDGYCTWWWVPYGEYTSNCSGRCGAGCNWFDDDYTWDCLDHDRCVDWYGGSSIWDNSNCGDEFWDADDDYWLTYGSWC